MRLQRILRKKKAKEIQKPRGAKNRKKTHGEIDLCAVK